MKVLKKLSLNIKIIFGVTAGILGFIFFSLFREKVRSKSQMKYELSRIKSELEIANLEEDSDDKLRKVNSLKQKEELIRQKIKDLEEKDTFEKREVTADELNDFFKDRGL